MIKVNQNIEFNNLLSIRRKMTQKELSEQMIEIGQVLMENRLKKNGPLITATFGVEMRGNEQICDVEVLVPLDREYELPEGYVFKKFFKLVNAVKIRHEGNPALIDNTFEKLNGYLQENKLQPITPAYNVTINQVNDSNKINEYIVDIYIGINPNIV